MCVCVATTQLFIVTPIGVSELTEISGLDDSYRINERSGLQHHTVNMNTSLEVTTELCQKTSRLTLA